ncbi:hypothetical protein LSAT2_024362 [Lamellibrachia satsuma]|nr:hypothetical protein LSAT2_024362 [Lamellibrachia satsuma]
MDLGGLHSISRVIIYNKCKAGYFGFRCRFQCHCRSGETCDDVTGQCPSDCPDDRWGVGCILSNEHYYNDPKGRRYMGKWNRTTHSPSSQPFNVSCKPWSSQTRYGDNLFPDGNRALAKNYCRNLDNYYYTWCVYNSNVNWAGCILTNRRCVTGRYDVNCVKECHCSQVTEDCQVNNGRCQTGCAPHFTGPTCQECEDGYFGVLCYGKCHCRSGSCDKTTGHCPSGCATGWTGDNCETDERVLSTFTLSVGNSSAINDHTQCASHKGQVAARAPINESCAATGRFLSFQRYGGDESHLAALCEVVVIGHRYINCQNCSSASTCNDVIGCDACAKGKQQPDCVNAIPQFLSSNKPKVEDIANSSVTVSWTEAENIPSGLEGHYFNLLWLQAEGEAEKIIKRVAQDPGNRQVNSRITGLQFNTKYSIRVKPYRQHNGEQVGGTATGVTRFKTSCIAPGTPVIEEIIASPPARPRKMTFVVIFRPPGESGCDEIVFLRVWYKRQESLTSTWSYEDVHEVKGTHLAIIRATYGVYEVKVTATNNDNISATSDIVLNLGTKCVKTDNHRQSTELSPIEKRPEVIEDASGYVRPTRESSQQEGHNVYDVIQA